MQCDQITLRGIQCPQQAVDGGTKCLHHGGNTQLEQMKKTELRNYRLSIFKEQVRDKIVSSELRSLTEEIGILRLTLESRLNLCKDELDLVAQSSSVAMLISNINSLVTAANKNDMIAKNYISREQLALFATKVVDIIAKNVTDSDTLNKIANEIYYASESITTDSSALD